ncbi:ParB N-terminal domain-containing protein [Clostridium sp. ZBS18]|uniref:ParB/RepB/Spo0J family partition protein n=1 Tax=Clostridium sp. ZBS18 TaxID=2949967 RepID=UPI00207AE5E6|nr:ParB N-terminal domain-containing protein [Clostridium sp. ZBS18]
MQKIKVSELKEHPMNTYYFDNMIGDKWKEFLESVRTSGVIEPIICNQNKVVISGNQRLRACKELNLDEVMCDIRIYDNEQQEIKDLIETNIRQRGDISSSSLKMGRIIKTLEECYGVKHGNNQYTEESANGTTQKDISNQLGTNLDSYKRAKKLLELIPELQEMLEQGKLSTSVGSRILARLNPEEQKEVLEDLGVDGLSEKTQAQLKEYINKLHEQEQENQKLKQALEQERNKLKEKEYIEKVVKIDNTDYSLKNKLNTLQDELNDKNKKYDRMQRKLELMTERAEIFEQDSTEYKDLKRQIEILSKEKDDIGKAVNSATELSGLVFKIESMLKTELCPITYSRAIMDMSSNETVMSNIRDIVEVVENWCNDMRKYLINNKNNIIINVEEN